MDWNLIIVAILAIAAPVAIMIKLGHWIQARHFTGWRDRPYPRCLRCRGTGWINTEPERTLNVVADGFEDRHTPSTVCPSCGGTGLAGG